MKNRHKIKLIAASVALMASFGAVAGLGGLNVHSNLGEPFSGSITVTGEEAKALLNGGKASISNGNLRATVRKSGDKAVVSIRSSKPVQDPILIFQVGVGTQSREYTAIIDPADYASKSDASSRTVVSNAQPSETFEEMPAVQPGANRAAVAQNNGSDSADAVRKSEKNNKKQAKAASKPNSNIAYGARYQVRQGDTLTGIATKLRPQGMTLAQTMQAIVNANPNAFVNNNADRILAGSVLNVPKRADLQSLADKLPAVRVPAESQEIVRQQQESGAAQASGPVAAEVKTDVPAPASAPVEAATAIPPAAASDIAASSAASDPAAASDPLQSNVASDVAEAAASVAAGQMEQAQEASDSESGLWKWLLLGGAALIAAFLLSKLLAGRKQAADEGIAAPLGKTPQVEEDEEDDVDFSQELTVSKKAESSEHFGAKAAAAAAAGVGAAAAVAAAASKDKPSDDELEIEDDFDDDIFFTETDTQAPSRQERVDVDWSAVDGAQGGIVSSAVTHDEETEKRRNVDWDTVESTESVYEPDTETDYQPVIQTIEAAAEEPEALSFETLPEEEDAPVAVGAEAEPEIRQNDDFEFFSAADAAEEPAESEIEAIAFDGADEESEPVVPSASVVSEEAEQEDDALEFSMEPLPEASEAQSFAEAGDVAQVAGAEVFDIRQDNAVSFKADDQDLAVSPSPEVMGIDETVEWEAIEVDEAVENTRSEAGFISESVGMTAPLEAKYELAKMYVEIGDPEAAKETLHELLEESDGSILEKTKALLQEIEG